MKVRASSWPAYEGGPTRAVRSPRADALERRHVVVVVVFEFLREAEVAQFEVAVRVEERVLRFEVAPRDVEAVHVLDPENLQGGDAVGRQAEGACRGPGVERCTRGRSARPRR